MGEDKARILCVDNDQETCEMMTALLGFEGFEVRHALTVAEGLQLAKKERFDLVLLDWAFKDGTGVELCQMIRSFDMQTPILFYSGIPYLAEVKRAMSVGAQGFFVKPLGMEDLLQSISLLSGKGKGKAHTSAEKR